MSKLTAQTGIDLELHDIQAAIVHPRPAPYVGKLVLVRVDDRYNGRELMRFRLSRRYLLAMRIRSS